jgi:hydroxymethylglutaryl-CoA reductase (NADPH)
MKLSQFKNTSERREFLEKEMKINLQYIKKAHIEDEKNINCENLIGETTLPLGVAGPIKIKNLKLKIKNYFYIPLATTEGALVASVNRGCKAINQSGGANVFVNKIGTTRGPVYQVKNLEQAFWFLNWLKKNEKKIKKQAEKTSAHLKYLKFETKILGVYVYVRFYFDCQEAMGMNMVTIAVDAINQLIEKETGIKCLSISGNFCIDKKPAWLDFFLGRGREVWAEVVLKEKVVKEILKTETQKLFEVWLTKIQLGSMVSGSLGFNGHFANIVAAFFAATGQDLAHVVEGSLGITTTKLLPNGDLYFSIYMPSVMIGKVGGGTKMEIKKEAIAIIGAKDSNQLAQILGAAVLAGEISLLSSLAEGSLVKAHTSLGRR